MRGTTRGTGALATKLLRDVQTLETRVKTVELGPAQIANGSVELLNEVSKSKITGEEERYSRIDLLDFAANVDRSRGIRLRPPAPRTLARRTGVANRHPLRRGRHGTVPLPARQRIGALRRSHHVRHAHAEPGNRRAGGAALARRRDRGRLMVELDRRALLSAAGAAGASALGAGVALDRFVLSDDSHAEKVVPFHATHRAGIATTAQDRLFFAAFDLTTTSVSDLRDLMRTWTEAAARMTAGATAGPDNDAQSAPPEDTGDALGLAPARLTITLAFGPSLFDDRFGLAARRPPVLVELPPFPGDELDPERSGGDLCVQACAADPQVVFHAVRNLARLARGVALMRWSQLGFGRTSSTSRAQSTPRNLMGFKDGTNNLKLEDTGALRDDVWVDEPSGLRDGTYLVARRIRMLIEVWDRSTLGDQERTIGRTKDEARRSAHAVSSIRSGSARCRSTRTCASRIRATGSSDAATRSPTACSRSSGSSTPGSSSSATRSIRSSSSSSSRPSASATS